MKVKSKEIHPTNKWESYDHLGERKERRNDHVRET